MFIALSFVGKLPAYIIECLHQIRIYFNEEIYLIIDDTNSEYINKIKEYNVEIIEYKDVYSDEFIKNKEINNSKFSIIDCLTGREELFIRSLERFFLVSNLMKKKKLNDCFFMELDNLIYDNPKNWLNEFSKYELCYMFDHFNRCSSGIMYIKNENSLDGFLQYNLNYINGNNYHLNEMQSLFQYYELNKETVHILPTFWPTDQFYFMTSMNYDKYNDTIFDALAIGCYLLGLDSYHTNGIIELGKKAPWCHIDYTNELFEWKIDEKGKRKPYIFNKNNNQWLLINNLHVHSKDLKSGLSIPL